MKNHPCYHCLSREIGCHAKCQKPEYLEWRAEHERVKKIRQQQCDERNLHQHYVNDFRSKYKRRHGIK